MGGLGRWVSSKVGNTGSLKCQKDITNHQFSSRQEIEKLNLLNQWNRQFVNQQLSPERCVFYFQMTLNLETRNRHHLYDSGTQHLYKFYWSVKRFTPFLMKHEEEEEEQQQQQHDQHKQNKSYYKPNTKQRKVTSQTLHEAFHQRPLRFTSDPRDQSFPSPSKDTVSSMDPSCENVADCTWKLTYPLWNQQQKPLKNRPKPKRNWYSLTTIRFLRGENVSFREGTVILTMEN